MILKSNWLFNLHKIAALKGNQLSTSFKLIVSPTKIFVQSFEVNYNYSAFLDPFASMLKDVHLLLNSSIIKMADDDTYELQKKNYPQIYRRINTLFQWIIFFEMFIRLLKFRSIYYSIFSFRPYFVSVSRKRDFWKIQVNIRLGTRIFVQNKLKWIKHCCIFESYIKIFRCTINFSEVLIAIISQKR